MTTQILQHEQQQAWPMASWGSSSVWSKRVGNAATAMDSESWEVRAFAEDASSSGQWPPRSYSCSFCQREFRTAQALGGHMNVHRRERAHANQLAQLRNATAMRSAQSSHTTTVELLSPKSERLNPTSSPLSQDSISSSTKPFLQSIPDIFSETLSQPCNVAATLSWTPSSRAMLYHPYEKSSPRSSSQGRFSLCLNKVMGEHEDALVDLELRLGRSSCAV